MASGTSIFTLFGSILVDSDTAQKSISDTGTKAEGLATKLGNGIKTAAQWGAGVAAGAVAAGAAVYKLATNSAAAADEIDKMSQKIGLSKQSYQEWNYAMGQSGVDIGIMQSGVKKMTDLMDSAANGTESAASTFEKLGVSIYDSTGSLKDQETMMKESIMALANMGDTTERAALASDIFGKSATELEPLLNSGADGIQGLIDRSHELGLVMSDEAVTAGVTFGDTMDDVKQSLGMIVTEAGVALMPMLQSILDFVIANMPQIQAIVGTVAEFIKTAISKVVEFWDVHGEQISASVSTVFQAIKTVIETVVSAVQAFWEEHGEQIVASCKKAFETIHTIVETVISAIKKFWDENGTEIVETFKRVFETIKTVVETVLNAIKAFWEEHGETIMTIVSTVWNTIRETISNLMDAIHAVIKTVTALINGDWEEAWEGIKELVSAIWDQIKLVVSSSLDIIKTLFSDAYNSFKEKGKAMFTAVWDGAKEVWESISTWVSDKISWLTDKLAFWRSGSAEMDADGSHASGLAYVPYDGYRAILHEGERVLTRNEAKGYQNTASPTNNFNISQLVVREEADIQKIAQKLYDMQLRANRSKGRVLV